MEGNVDDVNILNEVREKVREQGKVWWSLEANKGANWYLQTYVSSALKSSLKFSVLVNGITLKRLIRQGIPPVLRPKVWFSLSGATKKKSVVPDSYYRDLTIAVEGKVTPATKHIEHREEAEAGNEASDDLVVVESKQKPKKASKSKGVGLAEEDGKQKPEKTPKINGDGMKKTKKNKKKKEENDVSKIISEVRNPEEKG